MKEKKGFTIVEMAVALAVISLLLGTSIAFTSARIAAQKLQITKDRMNTITESIRMFAIHHGSLPCPADGSLASTASSFGIGQRTASPTDVCNADNTVPGVYWANNDGRRVVQGVVPVGTLGLSPEYIMDGWGRKFTYIIDEGFARAAANFWDSGCSPCGTACTNQSGNIKVCSTQDATGHSGDTCPSNREIVPRAPENLGAIFAVISHGPSGIGAWKGQGVARLGDDTDPTTYSYSKRENAEIEDDGPIPPGALNHVIVQSAAETGYDDIVEYRLKWQICDRRLCQCRPQ